MKNDFYLQSHAAIQGSTLSIICFADLVMDYFISSSFCTLYSLARRHFQRQYAKVNSSPLPLLSDKCIDVFISEFKNLLSHFAMSMRKLLVPSRSPPPFIVSLGSVLILNFNLISLIVSRCRRKFLLLVYHDSFSLFLQLVCSRGVFHMTPESHGLQFDDSASSASGGSSFDLNLWRSAFKGVNKFLGNRMYFL